MSSSNRNVYWHGHCRHVNDITGTVDLPRITDVDYVVIHDKTSDRWDGVSAAVLRLKDGRYMTWESWWGPTGSGFCEDAYGGDVDVWIADTLEDAVSLGLTVGGRLLLGLK